MNTIGGKEKFANELAIFENIGVHGGHRIEHQFAGAILTEEKKDKMFSSHIKNFDNLCIWFENYLNR